MQSRSHSVRSQKDFEQIARYGQRVENKLVRIAAAPAKLAYGRLGVVASRAVDKRAVVRNRLRRRVREWVRTHPEAFQTPTDMILWLKKESAAAPQSHFYEELRAAIEKLRR